MKVSVQYDDPDNNYDIPIKFVAKELGISEEVIIQAVKRAVEKY